MFILWYVFLFLTPKDGSFLTSFFIKTIFELLGISKSSFCVPPNSFSGSFSKVSSEVSLNIL